MIPLSVNFQDKVVVITGATGVLCGNMARAFTEAGAKVAAIGRNPELLSALESEIAEKGQILKGYACDVTDRASVEEVRSAVTEDLGVCDILINGVGGNQPKAITTNEYQCEAEQFPDGINFFSLGADDIDAVFRVNYRGTLVPTQVFGEDMAKRGKGCILNISSMASFVPLTKVLAYSNAKAAINSLTQWLATHFAASGIRVNAIAPGFILTKQNKTLLFDEEGNPTARTKKILAGTPAGRLLEPDELLGMTFCLCDDTWSSGTTGAVIPIDGAFASYSGV